MNLIPYWEAYRVAELLADLAPFPLPRASVGMEIGTNGPPTQVGAHPAASTRDVETTQKFWNDLSGTFNWLSRYRTLRAVAMVRSIRDDRYTAAVQRLAADTGLTLNSLRTEIRDKLLVLWQRWHWWREKSIPKPALAYLQEDIAIAVELLGSLSSQEVDAFDEFWDPPDPNRRLWTRLRDALPYEHWKCQEVTWQVGPAYLKNFNRVAPLGMVFDHGRLREAVRRWWRGSVPFRHFCVAFARLHDEINIPRDPLDLVGLRLSIPVEYLRLCALDTERFLVSLVQPPNASQAEIPGFKTLLLTAFDKLCAETDSGPQPRLRAELNNDYDQRTRLHDLPSTKQLPFDPLHDVAQGNVAGLVKACLFNLAVLRNYAAHHDCLDDEIADRGAAMPAIESMLALFALGLVPLGRRTP
ncbi:MAG: hypothetical protein LAO05_05970 [Acidobacteriia bacterium]|nr:hypothetical protein [Terriglobia bacterium]